MSVERSLATQRSAGKQKSLEIPMRTPVKILKFKKTVRHVPIGENRWRNRAWQCDLEIRIFSLYCPSTNNNFFSLRF